MISDKEYINILDREIPEDSLLKGRNSLPVSEFFVLCESPLPSQYTALYPSNGTGQLQTCGFIEPSVYLIS